MHRLQSNVRLLRSVQSVPRVEINVPGAILGKESSISINGEYHPVRWALVDAGSVEATMTKADNQFRDRTRAASEAQDEMRVVARLPRGPNMNGSDAGAEPGRAPRDLFQLNGEALRDARRTVWRTVIKLVTTGILAALIVGAAIKLKLMGGRQ